MLVEHDARLGRPPDSRSGHRFKAVFYLRVDLLEASELGLNLVEREKKPSDDGVRFCRISAR